MVYRSAMILLSACSVLFPLIWLEIKTLLLWWWELVYIPVLQDPNLQALTAPMCFSFVCCFFMSFDHHLLLLFIIIIHLHVLNWSVFFMYLNEYSSYNEIKCNICLAFFVQILPVILMCPKLFILFPLLSAIKRQENDASLNNGDIFWEIHCLAILSLCKHKVYFSRWYSLLLLGYRHTHLFTLASVQIWVKFLSYDS